MRRRARPPVPVPAYRPLLAVLALLGPLPAAVAGDEPEAEDASAPAGEAPGTPDAGAARLPWKLDRPYEYVWKLERRAAGSVVVVFREEEDAGGRLLRLHARREHADDRRAVRSSGDLWFQPDGAPVRYRGETVIHAIRGRGTQETRVRFAEGEVSSTIIPNAREENAVRRSVRAPDSTRLFATGALDHWVLFALELAGAEDERTLPVFYTEFGKVIEITFTPEAKESLEIGDREIEARRWRFRYRDFGDEGRIWIDARGRLLRYASGPTRLELRGY